MVVFGLVALREGWRLGAGTPAHMGPGFVPLALGVVLCMIGVAIACARDEQDWAERAPQRFDRRGGAMILGGAVAFIAVGSYAGLLPATFLCVFIAAMGDRVTTLKAAFLLSLAMTVISGVLFGFFLRVPIPLFVGL